MWSAICLQSYQLIAQFGNQTIFQPEWQENLFKFSHCEILTYYHSTLK